MEIRLIDDEGHGYDVFGMSATGVRQGLRLTLPFYRHWFRVESSGSDHVPQQGAAILAGNHSGLVPLDAAMVWTDVLERRGRVVRNIADTFVPDLPFISTLLARVGAVAGCRANVHHLLSTGELLMIFPEGTRGIGKPRRERYRLQTWRVGHAEMALRHRVPVIPVAIVGAEEQLPLVARLPIHLFGAPFVPFGVPLLLPVRYHIRYGAPLDLGDASADDPRAVAAAAMRVAAAVESLIGALLEERKGWFR